MGKNRLMTTTNDITGDEIKSKANNDKYLTNFDRIFGNKEKTANAKMEAKTMCVERTGKGDTQSKPATNVSLGNTSKRDRDTNNGDDV